MAKSILRARARNLRNSGKSIKEIAQIINVSTGSVSRWCNDIELSERQIAVLTSKRDFGLKKAQLIGSQVLKKRRLDVIKRYREEGLKNFSTLTRSEFFVAGLALYLAEGSKKNRKVMFTNSDQRVIRFMMKWLESFYQIKPNSLKFSLMVNVTHRDRQSKILDFWKSYLGIPADRFRKTVYIKSKRKKFFENREDYMGTLTIAVLKSTDLCYKILGQIEGLLALNIGPA